MKLQDKVTIVTGGAMGNGLGIVKVFLKYGAKVIIFDYSEKLNDTIHTLKEEGYEVDGYLVDIRDSKKISDAVNRVVEKYHQIDILVNNAGVAKLTPFLETTDEIRDFHFDINIKGTWNVSKAVVPYMKEGSSIVNLSSVTGTMVADTGEVAYATTKAAILGFLHDQSQARENKVLDITTKKRIMVIDIGGGTCDISVEDVEERDGQYVFAHLAVGRENLGGVDFDKRIADDLTRKYLKGVKLTDAELASLRDMGQKIKVNLSDQILSFCWENYDEEYSPELYDDPNWLDILENNLEEVQISREIAGETIHFKMGIRELVNSINPLIYQGDSVVTNKDERERNKNMESLIGNTLRDHDIDIDSIDYIFLTGGMAKCFPLRAALNDIYAKPIISPRDPLLAVSHGAALINKYRSIDETSKDLMPNSIMIEMNNGRLKPLIMMGEQVPVTKTVPEVFKTTSRKGVVIRLYEGKNEFDCQLRRINNEYVIKTPDLPPVGREFTIRYTVDKAKRLKFYIVFNDTSEEFEITGQIKEGK